MISWLKYLEFQQLSLKSTNVELHENQLDNIAGSILSKLANPNFIIFTAGNGGSSTTADHFSADLNLSYKRAKLKIRAICLNSHLGLNTALSNDISYAEALKFQFMNYIPGPHMIIVFSVSGNSRNVIELLELAVQNNIECWAFLGCDGGQVLKIKGVNSIVFHSKDDDYGIVENSHLVATHYIIKKMLELSSENS